MYNVTFIRLKKYFSYLYGKVVDLNDMLALKLFITKILYVLKVCIPPLFLYLMQHSLIHLVDEL